MELESLQSDMTETQSKLKASLQKFNPGQGYYGKRDECGETGKIISHIIPSERERNDTIVLTFPGEKGSDETKLCVAIENQRLPNSPQGLLLLACYEGQDDYENMRIIAFAAQ
uniref:Uncharacterized protein n=1 Tax=Caenorhabditis japonica TaxID=281687 RepID=A0A8R1E8F4_CAEJA